MAYAVEVQSLSRVFDSRKKPIVALDNVDLTVREGELFGLLGPNGAGKTTLLKILSTLLLPTSGTAKVLGYGVEKDANKIRSRINMVSGGEISGYGLLTVRENLWMFTQFYGIPSKEAKRKIDDFLEEFGLADKADSKVRTISTGQRQKMNVIRGFITNPDLIFLDEPTLGLDVQTSHTIRSFIRDWVKEREGRTLLLTTHYMKEAEELCERVAIIDNGRILACDTPTNLKKEINKSSSFVIQTTPILNPIKLESLAGVAGATIDSCNGSSTVRVVVSDEAAISDIISTIVGGGAKVTSLSKTEPTLEDVFIQLVGRGLG